MTFTSVTTWQAEQYEVEIRLGVFDTVAQAAAMGRSGIQKILLDGLGLCVDLSDGTRAPVPADGIIVRRRRPEATEAVKHRALTDEDFETVPMTLDEMSRDADMCSGFGSQAYGVVNANGDRVALPSTN